jgi:glycosyltransferase involved in cell wall biosynthesis
MASFSGAMAGRAPRIVHLITRLELGGAQQNTLFCVEHHDRTRFRVALWAGEGGRLDSAARAIRTAEVRIVPWLVHPVAPVRDAIAVLRLARMLSDVDLIHTHSSKAGILGRCAGRLAGVTGVVHTVHGWSFNDAQPAVERRLYVEAERAAARVTDRIVCVSRFDRERGLAAGIGHPAQYRVLRSGIDASSYVARPGARERLREELGATPDDVVVGSIANFKPQKSPLDFIEAARLARRSESRLRFYIAGDGVLRPEVERAIADAGLGDVVRLLGWRDDVPELLAATDIFLLTSLFEGLPRTVLQAMAASVPVVATDTGGVAEVIVPGETGLLVPPGVPVEAADAIVALAREPRLREKFAAAGRARLTDEFDNRRMVRDLEDLYDEVLGKSPPKTAATSPSHLAPAR